MCIIGTSTFAAYSTKKGGSFVRTYLLEKLKAIPHTPWAVVDLKHLHNVKTPFHCPQTILSVDLQRRDDFSELKGAFWG